MSAPQGLIALLAVAAVLALAFALTALLVGDRDDGRSAVESAGPVQTIAVELGDLYVKPHHIEVPSGTATG
jgi:hypothetical protein